MDADAAGTLVLRSPLPGEYGWVIQLEAARHIYERAGFELVAEEPPTLQFGTWQVSETWRLVL
jgi:hypothetical protein